MSTTLHLPPPDPDPTPVEGFREFTNGHFSAFLYEATPFAWLTLYHWSVVPTHLSNTLIEDAAPTLDCAAFCALLAIYHYQHNQPQAVVGSFTFPPKFTPGLS